MTVVVDDVSTIRSSWVELSDVVVVNDLAPVARIPIEKSVEVVGRDDRFCVVAEERCVRIGGNKILVRNEGQQDVVQKTGTQAGGVEIGDRHRVERTTIKLQVVAEALVQFPPRREV